PASRGESGLSPPTRSANSGVMPHRISLPILSGWRPWLNWEILWWGSTQDATPLMTLPCSARQASQALRSPSPAKHSDGQGRVRGFEKALLVGLSNWLLQLCSQPNLVWAQFERQRLPQKSSPQQLGAQAASFC